MESKPNNPTFSHPAPDAPHETFDWRVAPVVLQDACCLNPKCGTYKQPELSRLQFQTRPSYPIQVRCQECHTTWHSVNVYFRRLYPIKAEALGTAVTLGSLGALPFLPWSITVQYIAAGSLFLAQGQIGVKLYLRGQRKRAYRLFAQLTATAPLYHDTTSLEELQQRLSKLPGRFDRDLRQSLLALTKALQERGLARLALLQQALLLHRQGAYPRLQRQVHKARLEPGEREKLDELLHLLQQINATPTAWEKLPQLFQDILDSLQQDLSDWPQSAADEAQEILKNIRTLHREAQDILQQLTQITS